jgi:putative glutamine amidotransferase
VSYRPLVAVVGYHLGSDRVSRWPEGGYGVPAPYLDALRRAGARTAIVSPGEPGEPEELLDAFDGLMLVGGGDVDPSRYGREASPGLYGVEPDRDDLEMSLLRAAAGASLPTLCICRGMQVMNVTFGGTLHRHLPDVPGLSEHGVPVANTQTVHDVAVEPGTRLRSTTAEATLACSSHHHQGVDGLGDGLVASGRSADGLIEAIELDAPMDEHAPWMIGVQWHPEDTAVDDRAQQSLFDALSSLARWRGSRTRPGEMRGRTRDYSIVEADPAWASWFEREAADIHAALGEAAIRIDHVGSTSVPGLAAKPVIDIQVSLASMEPRSGFVPQLEGLGYRFVVDPVESEHEFLSKGYDPDAPRKFHVHVCRAGGDWERRHLAFRDWLRAHPETPPRTPS